MWCCHGNHLDTTINESIDIVSVPYNIALTIVNFQVFLYYKETE